MPIKMFIPPGGFAGFAQQTQAVQTLIAKPAARRKSPVRRKKTTKRRAGTRARKATTRRAPVKRAMGSKKRTTGASQKPARMVKGSPAAKRHMAKLRKMRRR